jgi:hypothetical protein
MALNKLRLTLSVTDGIMRNAQRIRFVDFVLVDATSTLPRKCSLKRSTVMLHGKHFQLRLRDGSCRQNEEELVGSDSWNALQVREGEQVAGASEVNAPFPR